MNIADTDSRASKAKADERLAIDRGQWWMPDRNMISFGTSIFSNWDNNLLYPVRTRCAAAQVQVVSLEICCECCSLEYLVHECRDGSAVGDRPSTLARAVSEWMDGIDAGWAIPLLLIGLIPVGLILLTIAYFNSDLSPDTLEAWSSGRSLELGYAKIPPLAAWVAHGWTFVFPLANWSFRLLALINAALALWAVDLISRRFVQGDRRLVTLLLLMLLPIYQSQAQQFDANAVLLVAWPLATYCFLRSFETGRIGWAVAAGATAALALLGNYQSVFLIASLAVAALVHPRRLDYRRSRAPWVSAMAGLAVLGPHLYWLATTGAQPFTDALGQLTAGTSAISLIDALLVALGAVLLVGLPIAIWGLMVPGRFRRLSRVVRAIEPGQLLLLLVGVGTLVFPAITAIALGIGIMRAGEFQGLFLLVILIVCGSNAPFKRSYSVNLAAFMAALAVVSVVVAAPLHALYRNSNALDKGRNFYRLSAVELTRQWHEQSTKPLAAVGGDEVLALAAAFYSPDHPVVEPELLQPESWPSKTTYDRGWASLCFDSDAHCITSMERVAVRAPQVAGSEFAVQSNLLGLDGVEQHFAVLLAPPSTSAPAPAAKPAPAVAEAPSVASSPAVAEGPSGAASPSAAEPSSLPRRLSRGRLRRPADRVAEGSEASTESPTSAPAGHAARGRAEPEPGGASIRGLCCRRSLSPRSCGGDRAAAAPVQKARRTAAASVAEPSSASAVVYPPVERKNETSPPAARVAEGPAEGAAAARADKPARQGRTRTTRRQSEAPGRRWFRPRR